jgi:phosphoserine phosphatase
MIEPVAKQVNVPAQNIYANTIFFDENGRYKGFDANELTSRDGGKAEAINMIKKKQNHAMVGDGVTDLQARPPADLFIGFGGIVARQVIQENADWFIRDFDELTQVLVADR